MYLLRLSLRSYARSIQKSVGVGPSGLVTLASVVLLLCAGATAVAIQAVLSMGLEELESAQVSQLREDFAHGFAFLAVLAGLFVGAAATPGDSMRLLLRQTGGSGWDQYLLTSAVRDLLAVVVALTLAAVTLAPFAVLARHGIGFGPALTVAILACALTSIAVAAALDLLKAVALAVGMVRSDGAATAVAGGTLALAAVWLTPLPLVALPGSWQWALLTPEGRLSGGAAAALVVLGIGAACMILLQVLLGGWRERQRPVFRRQVRIRTAVLFGRSRLAVAVSFTVLVVSRLAVALCLGALGLALALAGLMAEKQLDSVVFLSCSAAVCGAVGLRVFGHEHGARWLMVTSAGPTAAAYGMVLATLLVVTTIAAPMMVVAVLVFGAQAAGYFLILALTGASFSLLAGTLIPVRAEEPLSVVGAAAVSFALSGGVVGLLRAGLAERSESAAASVAMLGALGAVVAAAEIARRRHRLRAVG